MADATRLILVIEDNADIADSIREILEYEGYGVRVAPTGEQALEVLTDGPGASLILLDVKLPDMSGGELMSVLADLSQFRTPVVVVTAGKEIPPNVDGVLYKPFDVDALLELVRKFVG